VVDESSHQHTNQENSSAGVLDATAHKLNVIADIRAEEQALPPEFELPHDNPEQ
jgi:hypothetical protein